MTKSLLIAVCVWLLGATFASAQTPSDAGLDAGVPESPEAGPPAKLDAGGEAAPQPDAGGDGGAPPSADAGPDAASDDPFAELAADAKPSTAPQVIAPDESLFRVDAVEVLAPRDEAVTEAPGSVYLVDEQQLEKFDFDDAHQVLSQIPGVYVRQEDGYGLRPNIGMRGADPDRSKKVTLMEDGVLFGPAPYSAPAAYYFPIMTRMVGVEVFKGASAIRFGPQTIGGGLDLRTRETPYKGSDLGLDASIGNTFYSKLHAYGGYGTPRWGLMSEGVHLSSAGFKELDGGGDTGFSKQELMLKGRVNTDPDARIFQRLELKFGYSQEDSRESYLGLTDADFRANPQRRYAASRLDEMKFWRTQVELRHVLEAGEHFTLTTVAYRHDFSRLWNRLDGLVEGEQTGSNDRLKPLKDITDAGEGELQFIDYLRGKATAEEAKNARLLLAGNDRDFVSQGIQSVARRDFKTGAFDHDLELGVRVHHDAIDRDHSATSYSRADKLDEPPDVEIVKRPKLADNEVTTLAVAAHLFYALTYQALTLSPGIRMEIIRATYTEHLGEDVGEKGRSNTETLLFALGARYALVEELALIAGVQQGMSPVAPDKGSINGATTSEDSRPEPDVERALNYEGGLRFTKGLTDASVIGFFSDYDQVAVTSSPETGDSRNEITEFSGSAAIYGVEWAASTRLVLPRSFGIPVRGAYTYTIAEFSEPFETNYAPWGETDGRVEKGDAMPYVPPHQFSASAGVDFREKVGIDLNLTFMDRMREEAGQGALETGKYTDRYALLDAVAFYQVLENLRVYVKGDNLTNNQPIVSRRPFGARPNKPLLVQIGCKWDL